MQTRTAVGYGLGLIALAVVHLATPGPAQAEEPDRPNIVFILIDDLAHEAMGFTDRYPFLETPHIDRLAEEGARFENAFVTTSLCCPSRASFLTGLHAHNHGVATNQGQALDRDRATFPKLLQQAGYRTAFFGKWHMGGSAKPRAGFDHWLGFRGQGQYHNPHFNENGRQFHAEGYMTDLLTEHAVAWLKRREGGDEPFMMYLSHKAVHGPRTPPEGDEGMYAGQRMAKPVSFEDDYADKPRWMRRAERYGGRREAWRKSEGKSVPDAVDPGDWQGGSMRYFELIPAMDESVGAVLETLQQQGELDETLVVFTSDNGMFLGRHHRGDKRLAYEASIRIPMLVRYPRMIEAGSTIEPMALNIDIAPTFLELANEPVPEHMQGRSLLPLLQGESPSDWRDAFFYAYYQENWWPAIPTMHAVRTARWKYITTPNRSEQVDELYDLENDPHEMNNLAVGSSHENQLSEMRELLAQFKARTGYVSRAKARRQRLANVPLQSVMQHGTDVEGAATDVKDTHENAWADVPTASSPHGPALVLESDSPRRYTPDARTMVHADKPLTVGAWVKPASEDGVLIAHGGKSQGFSLYLENGIPHFAIRSGGALYTVAGEKQISQGEWTHLAGRLSIEPDLRLLVDGQVTATAEGQPLQAQPNGRAQSRCRYRLTGHEAGASSPPGRAPRRPSAVLGPTGGGPASGMGRAIKAGRVSTAPAPEPGGGATRGTMAKLAVCFSRSFRADSGELRDGLRLRCMDLQSKRTLYVSSFSWSGPGFGRCRDHCRAGSGPGRGRHRDVRARSRVPAIPEPATDGPADEAVATAGAAGPAEWQPSGRSAGPAKDAAVATTGDATVPVAHRGGGRADRGTGRSHAGGQRGDLSTRGAGDARCDERAGRGG
jgi:N-acetylglucosamine-6-sulfatase